MKKVFLFTLLLVIHFSCQVPQSDFVVKELIDELQRTGDTICLNDGFDVACIKVIQGQKLIAVREVPVEVIVEKIVETVVIEEVIKEVPVEAVTERVATELGDAEVPIEDFVVKTVEVIKEVVKEVEVIKEVPVEVIVTEIETVYVEVPVDRTVYRTQGYIDWVAGEREGVHPHDYPHDHAPYGPHVHWFVHSNNDPDDYGALHRNLNHD